MPVTNSFLSFVLDQLDGCGSIVSKRMFGGVGLYAGDVFFAVMMDDTIYLKVDDVTRARYEAAGSRAFNPFPERSATGSMQYYEVPLAVLEDADELTRWARESIRAAGSPRGKTTPRSASRASVAARLRAHKPSKWAASRGARRRPLRR